MTKRNGPNKVLVVATVLGFSLGLTASAGVVGAFAEEKGDLQAPRVVRSDSSPGLNDPVQAPRGQDTQPPRGQDVQAPRGQDTQTPRGFGGTVRGE